jgi:Xaa-Pro aminopeptidase
MSLRVADEVPPIGEDEYRLRLERTQAAMEADGFDALLVTAEPNFRYLTGFNSQTWVNLTRPRYCIVPLRGDPIAICPKSNVVIFETTSWLSDIRTWPAPRPEDDGVSLVADALESCLGRFRRVGAELGAESRLGMPVGDFLRIKDAIAPALLIDGEYLLRRVRMVKSQAEIARCRAIGRIASDAFARLSTTLRIGDTERDAAAKLQADLLAHGAEKMPYVIAVSGQGGYPCINMGPSDRTLERGDVLIIDTGSTFDGYFCDFDREYAIGNPGDDVRRAYEKVWKATSAGIAAVRPGVRTCDVWQAMATALDADAVSGTGVGRMGHGLGLQMTEWPSISRTDQTVLAENMVITIEPGIAFATKDRQHRVVEKVLVHEENIVVTTEGSAMLTRRAPPEMPIVC